LLNNSFNYVTSYIEYVLQKVVESTVDTVSKECVQWSTAELPIPWIIPIGRMCREPAEVSSMATTDAEADAHLILREKIAQAWLRVWTMKVYFDFFLRIWEIFSSFARPYCAGLRSYKSI